MRNCLGLLVLGGLAIAVCSSARAGQYVQTNLVSDLSGMAPETDTNLKNPWGVSFSGTSPFWVSDQGSDKATLYNALASPVTQTLVVNMSNVGSAPPTGPTGQVFNSTSSDFQIPALGGGTVKSTFLFDTLDGTIQGWNPGSTSGLNNSAAILKVAGAVFTGLALGNVGTTNYLYAANAAGNVQVFDGTFHSVTSTTFAGKFVDPNPVAGFTPYNIQKLSDGNLYVTYAAATNTGAPLPGGYVDAYDTAGNFIRRIATGGPINAPWGLAIAPSTGFGQFSGDLLVGNLYDSKIYAYKLSTPTPQFDGLVTTVNTGFASPVGLWALDFGNGKTGNFDTLYFTAGINDQKDGLFGAISFVPEPGSCLLLFLGISGLGLFQGLRRQYRKTFST